MICIQGPDCGLAVVVDRETHFKMACLSCDRRYGLWKEQLFLQFVPTRLGLVSEQQKIMQHVADVDWN